MLRRDDIIRSLRESADAIRAQGVSALFLYGSYARGEAGRRSDIDVFVDHDDDPRFSLVELAGVQRIIEEATGLPVDVTTRESLRPALRRRILADAVRVI